MAFENKSQLDLIALLNAGASFTFDGSRKSHIDLLSLLQAAKRGGGTLTLRNISNKSHTDLLAIINAGGKNLVIGD
ncbi:hypothetical protein [Pseudomonas delhiensis]|uniref:hypothetical protein n=1 Tax=Pseudomonas delhiensis TaxID=366289 RepID=UPI00315A2D6A